MLVAQTALAFDESCGTRLACLLHDAHEALIGDIAKPTEELLQITAGLYNIDTDIPDIIKTAKVQIDDKICENLGIRGFLNPAKSPMRAKAVKRYDHITTHLEAEFFFDMPDQYGRGPLAGLTIASREQLKQAAFKSLNNPATSLDSLKQHWIGEAQRLISIATTDKQAA